MNTSLADIKKDYFYIPEPTRTFEVGEKVTIPCRSNYTKCMVKDILEDYKVYLIASVETDPKTKKSSIVENYFVWMEVYPYIEELSDTVNETDRNLQLNYSQRQLEGLFTMCYNFGVDFDPDYQRPYIWTEEQRTALIDSIFHGVDIGKFVFIHHTSVDKATPMYEILDGKQRLLTLLAFYEGAFQYKGRYFYQLNNMDRSHFLGYYISYAEYRNISREQILRAFILLNTGGVSLDTRQLEIVKSIYKVETGKTL